MRGVEVAEAAALGLAVCWAVACSGEACWAVLGGTSGDGVEERALGFHVVEAGEWSGEVGLVHDAEHGGVAARDAGGDPVVPGGGGVLGCVRGKDAGADAFAVDDGGGDGVVGEAEVLGIGCGKLPGGDGHGVEVAVGALDGVGGVIDDDLADGGFEQEVLAGDGGVEIEGDGSGEQGEGGAGDGVEGGEVVEGERGVGREIEGGGVFELDFSAAFAGCDGKSGLEREIGDGLLPGGAGGFFGAGAAGDADVALDQREADDFGVRRGGLRGGCGGWKRGGEQSGEDGGAGGCGEAHGVLQRWRVRLVGFARQVYERGAGFDSGCDGAEGIFLREGSGLICFAAW
jgi:hypothetical protein